MTSKSEEEQLKGEATLEDITKLARIEYLKRQVPDETATFLEVLKYHFEHEGKRLFFVLVICLYLFSVIFKSQLAEEWTPDLLMKFTIIDFVFTGILSVELIFNIMLTPCTEYFKSYWNIYDTIVIPASWIILIWDVTSVDWFLAFRCFKIFQQYKHTKEVSALFVSATESLGASIVLLVFLFVVLTFYSIAAVEWFIDCENIGKTHFGNFSRALYTLLQCLTGDSWSSGVGRETMILRPWFGFFFWISFCIFVMIISLNLFAAVFFDAFLTGKATAEEDHQREQFRLIFEVLDDDGSGYLDRDELEQLKEQLEIAGMTMDVDELFRQADSLDDEEIGFEEFYNAYKALYDPSILKHQKKYQQLNEKLNALNSFIEDFEDKQQDEKKTFDDLETALHSTMHILEELIESQEMFKEDAELILP